MAQGSQTLTTYYAKRIIGDSAANGASSALLQTGSDITANTWILNRTNRGTTNPYGIYYYYDTSGTADKIQFIGGITTDSTSNGMKAEIELDSGNIKLDGNLYMAASKGIYMKHNNNTDYEILYNYGNGNITLNGAGDELNLGYKETQAIQMWYSPHGGTRKKWFIINSKGAEALTRLGVNGQNTSYTLYVDGTTNITGITSLTSTTSATSTSTGALVVSGGVGIGENLYIGGNSSIGGTLNVTSATTLGSTLAVSGDTTVYATSGAARYVRVYNDTTKLSVSLYIGSGNQNHGLYSNGYLPDGAATRTSDARWIIYRNKAGEVVINEGASKTTIVSGLLSVNGAATFSSSLSADTIAITNTSATPHLTFSRNGMNYIIIPNNSSATLSIGKGASAANSFFDISDSYILSRRNLYLNGTASYGVNTTTQIAFTNSNTNTQYVAITANTSGALIIRPTTSSDSTNQILLIPGGKSEFNTGTLTIGTSGQTTYKFKVDGTTNITGATTLDSTLSVAGVATVTSSTAASSTSTGALIVTGGAGIGGKLYTGGAGSIGGALTVTGNITMNGSSRYKYIYIKNTAGNTAGQILYDHGNATNITAGRFYFYEYSPNSPADTANNGKYERYLLPAVTANRSTSPDYNIITQKNLTDITTVGTITSGTWNGSIIGAAYGGTGVKADGQLLGTGFVFVTENATAPGDPDAAQVTYSIKASPLPVANGGTGASSFTKNCAIISGSTTTGAFTTRAITNNTSATAVTANTNLITANTLYYHTGNSNITTVGTITSGTWSAGNITAKYMDVATASATSTTKRNISVRYGTTSVPYRGSGATVTFGTPFGTSCIGVSCLNQSADFTATSTISITSVTKSGFKLFQTNTTNANGMSVNWIAFGY